MSKRNLAILLLAWSSAAFAAPFTGIVVYGDSLADNGNLFAAIGQPAAPYYMGRSSNGPVAVEQLTSLVDTPTLLDFAWAGATTGIGNHLDAGTPTHLDVLPGMLTEFAASQPLITPYLANGLFILQGGPNDFLSPDPTDAFPAGVAARAVNNLVGLARSLQGLGAQHILVSGLPDLGLTPFYMGLGPGASAQASALSDQFNGLLKSQLPSGVVFVDTAGLLRAVINDPSAYGFTNVTDACLTTAGICATPSSYLFWDDFHPTTAGHAVLAEQFRTAVPEPATTGVTLVALAALYWRSGRPFPGRRKKY